MSTLSLHLRGVEAGHELPHEPKAKVASVSLLVHSVGLLTLVVAPLLQTTNLPEVAAAAAPPLPRTILVNLPPAPLQAAPRRAPKGGRPAQSAAVFPTTPTDTPTTLNLVPAFDLTLDPVQDVGIGDPVGGVGDGSCPLGSLCGAASVTTQPPTPSLVRIGGAIREPRLRESRAPVYPPLAQAARAEGTVVLEAHIGTDGRVMEVRITQSHRLFDEAALASVRTRRYDPLLLNGVPTEFLVTITVAFNFRR